MDQRHKFKIHIGDYSGDGHGKFKDYVATANKPIEAVRAAYLAAKKAHRIACPENYCDGYEECRPNSSTLNTLEALGAPAKAIAEFRDDCPDDLNGALVQIVVWFIMLGDPDLRVELQEEERLPSLQGGRGRDHIGPIGYGMF